MQLFLMILMVTNAWGFEGYIKPPQHISEAIEDHAEFNELDPIIFEAMIRWESTFNPNIVNKEGQKNWRKRSVGLGQIQYSTAYAMGFRGKYAELKDVETNLSYAAQYLREQLDRYEGSYYKAISAYNAGRYYRRHKNKPHVVRILIYARRLRDGFSDQSEGWGAHYYRRYDRDDYRANVVQRSCKINLKSSQRSFNSKEIQ